MIIFQKVIHTNRCKISLIQMTTYLHLFWVFMLHPKSSKDRKMR